MVLVLAGLSFTAGVILIVDGFRSARPAKPQRPDLTERLLPFVPSSVADSVGPRVTFR